MKRRCENMYVKLKANEFVMFYTNWFDKSEKLIISKNPAYIFFLSFFFCFFTKIPWKRNILLIISIPLRLLLSNGNSSSCESACNKNKIKHGYIFRCKVEILYRIISIVSVKTKPLSTYIHSIEVSTVMILLHFKNYCLNEISKWRTLRFRMCTIETKICFKVYL